MSYHELNSNVCQIAKCRTVTLIALFEILKFKNGFNPKVFTNDFIF